MSGRGCPVEKFVHVVVEELRTIFFARTSERVVELLQRIRATFRMRKSVENMKSSQPDCSIIQSTGSRGNGVNLRWRRT